jgi:hypothetical protein
MASAWRRVRKMWLSFTRRTPCCVQNLCDFPHHLGEQMSSFQVCLGRGRALGVCASVPGVRFGCRAASQWNPHTLFTVAHSVLAMVGRSKGSRMEDSSAGQFILPGCHPRR